jgi:hypothetical protein
LVVLALPLRIRNRILEALLPVLPRYL